MRNAVLVVGLLGVITKLLPAQQPPEDEATKLAKATQNPVADLVSLPFQFNFNTGGGLDDQTLFVLNFQPVVPVKGLLRHANIIARTIVPYVSAPTGTARAGGLGDIQAQFFLTPVKSGKLIWGVGPVFSLPTATADPTRTGSWALGPTGVALLSHGPWLYGALVNNLFTFADEGGSPKVNSFLLQPFVNYNFAKGWALTTAPIITANWDASSGNEWTIPLGGGFSKTTVFNGRPISFAAQYYHNLEYPDGSGANQVRIQINLLYPSQPKPPAKP